jgi:hypothetical protein
MSKPKSEQVDRFLSDRDSALRSLDRDKIEFYCRKYNIQMPKHETVFWLAVHKARLQITWFTEEEKNLSAEWIRDHGFKQGVSE